MSGEFAHRWATRRRRTLVALGVVLAELPACEAPDDAPWHDGLDAWEGEYLTYYSSPSLEVCAGTHEYIDGFVPFVAGELGLTSPHGLAYGWLDNATYHDAAPCPDAGGCHLAGSAFALDPVHLHEVVHAVTWHHNINGLPFLREGIAVAFDWGTFGPAYVQVIEGGVLPDPQPLMAEQSLNKLEYFLAGGFVAFLLALHGSDKFVALARGLDKSTDLTNIQQVFHDIYGVELDAEAARFVAGVECPIDPFPLPVYDCAMPEIAWESALSWTFTQDLDCASEGVVGGVGDGEDWMNFRAVTLEIPVTGRYAIQTVSDGSDGDTRAQLGACFGCPWDLREKGFAANEAKEVDLDAGTYYLRLGTRSNQSPKITVKIEPVP